MNYYNRYPAHYLAKTLLLTLEQDGGYTRLMDWYYAEERAIPHDKRYTVARCQSKRERDAVDFVLSEFFVLRDGLWVHDRIEKELDKAAPKIDAARENGKKGGRPRKEKPNGFQNENPMGFQNQTQQEPRTKAPQTPVTNRAVGSTEVHTNVTTGDELDDGVCDPPSPVIQAAILLRKRGCLVTPQNPDLIEAIREGVKPKALDDMAELYPGKPAGYVITAARREHAQKAAKLEDTTHANGTPGRKLSAAEQVQQAILERRQRESGCDAPLVAIGY